MALTTPPCGLRLRMAHNAEDHTDPGSPMAADDRFLNELVANTRRLYVYISTIVPPQAEAEDIYQQTCLALWQKRHLYDSTRPFFAWACGFARNEALRYLRTARSSRMLLTEKTLDAIAVEQGMFEPERIDLRRAALYECLDALHPRQQSLLKRCYAEDDTIHSIAQEMKISPAALTMRLQRIRHAFVKCVEQTLGTWKATR